jgi:ankyrin repeat protein
VDQGGLGEVCSPWASYLNVLKWLGFVNNMKHLTFFVLQVMTNMAAAVKSGEFRAKFRHTLRTMSGWRLMQKVLERKNKSERIKVLSESFHQRELENGILEACKLGMMETVEFLIEKCDVPVVNIRDECVWYAANQQYSGILKYFIEKHSVDVNIKNSKGMGVVQFACLAGDKSLVEYLVNKGADLTCTDDKNVNCLMAGAWAGSVKICEMALRAGVDINAKSSRGEHILHGTIRQGSNVNECRLHVIDYLVKAGADVNSVNGDNIPVVIYAALSLHGSTKTLGYFLKHPQVDMDEKIDAIKLGGAFLITTGNETRGLKFWKRAIKLQEKQKLESKIENNSMSCSCNFSNYEPTCVADVQKIKTNPDFSFKFLVALVTKLHVRFGYDCINQLECLVNPILSQGFFDLYLDVFAFLFLHTFPNNQNVKSIPDYESAFRIICAIVAWKDQNGDEIFPQVLKFFKKMTMGFEKKRIHCKAPNNPESENDLTWSQRELRSMLMNVLGLFFPNDAEDDGDDSDGWSDSDDYKDGKHKNMYMKLMIKLSALIIEIFPTHKQEFLPCLLKLLHTRFRDEKQATFLHVAVNCIDICLVDHGDEGSQVDLVKMMIECGEDVNATDRYLCTPAHDLVGIVHSGNRHLIQEVLNVMVQYGAHLDIRNKTGWSGLDELMDFDLTVHPVANQSLQCLAAKVIMEENLDYQSCVPKALWDFIKLHDPEEHITDSDIPHAYFSKEEYWFNPEEHVCEI